MAYTKQTWTDGTTQANAADMSHIEDGIFNAAATADAALAGNLTIGTTSTTAKAGNWKPTIADLPSGSTITVLKDATTGFWPTSYSSTGLPSYTSGSSSTGVRPTSRTDIFVRWKGASPFPAFITSGTAGVMGNNIDDLIETP